MDEIKILYLYPDILDLYGDTGNIEVLNYRCKKRNILCTVDRYSIDSPKPDFLSYDLIYLGGGADYEQQILANDLNRHKNDIHNAFDAGVFFLLICGGYQLFGKYYKDSNGENIPGLGVFDYHTKASLDKRSRCIGNIIIEAEIEGEKTKVIGFENHGGQTSDIAHPFGKVLLGNGNCFGGKIEGYMDKNVIATYLHGPLLSKNPAVADHIISYCLSRCKGKKVTLPPMDDKLENTCRESLFKRFLSE